MRSRCGSWRGAQIPRCARNDEALLITQSQLSFDSGGKTIRLDAYLPAGNGASFPAVVALYGAGGGVEGMGKPAALLAEQGFAVYVLHYFDRTDTKFADKATALRNFPVWMKTL